MTRCVTNCLVWLLAGVGWLALESTQAAHGAIVPFRVEGPAGLGLLPGNVIGTVTNGGTGGIVGTGISYNDVSRDLTINVAWGASQGFVNLSGPATEMHIHGPATIAQTGGILLTLHNQPGFTATANGGGFSGIVNIPIANVADFLSGRLYIDVHTSANSNGEIRGNLVVVPEPNSMILMGLAAFVGSARMRKRLIHHR